MHPYVHSSQDMEAAWVSSDRRVGTEDMAHTHSGILFGCEKNKIMSSVATWMDLEIMTLREVNETKTNIM